MSEIIWNTYWSDVDNHDWWLRPSPEVLELIRAESPEIRPRVLDLGCGLGRHAIAFALAGYQVTATDQSAEAIAHLQGWALSLDLPINTMVCDVLDDYLPNGFFDIIVSYNVIYHGYREQFVQAIRHCHALLKCGGLFFFTCPSRRDGKYGYGEEVALHTFLCAKSVTPGDMHYFTDEHDLDELLQDFTLWSRQLDEGYWDNDGVQQFASTWQVLAEKR